MDIKNIWKKITRRENRTRVIATSGTFFIVFLFLGLLGILITLNVFFTLPFLFGITDVSQGGGIVERTKGFWSNRSKGQKVGIAFGFIVLVPFIMLSLMWIITMGTAFLLDIIIILPIVLLVGFFVFRNPERQTNAVSKVLGHPAMGIIAIIFIVAILVLAGLSFMDAHRYDDARTNFADNGTPLHTSTSDFNTTIERFFNETTQQWENRTVTTQKLADTVLFKVVDDFFYEVGFVPYLNQSFDNITSTTNLYDTDGQLPVDNAKLSLACYDVNHVQLLAIGGMTTPEGLCSFNKVPFGIYELTVDASGYLKFNYEIHINENFTVVTVIVHMKPIYYKVALDYMFYINEPVNRNWIVYKSNNVSAYIVVDAKFLGGLNDGDLKSLRRQQSWYGWSGLPYTTSLTNSVLKLYNQEQQILQQIQSWWGYIGRAFLPTISTSHVETIHYTGHSVTVTEVKVVTAQAEEMDTYYKQIPTPNVRQMDAELLDEYLKTYNDYQLNTTNDGYPPKYFGNVTNDTDDSSASPQRRYEYIVWTESPDSQSIRIQFKVVTYYIKEVYTDGQWSFIRISDKSKSVVRDEQIVSRTFTNLIPSVESKPVGG